MTSKTNRVVAIISCNSPTYKILANSIKNEEKIVLNEKEPLTFDQLNSRLESNNTLKSIERTENSTKYIIFEDNVLNQEELCLFFNKCDLILVISKSEESFYNNCVANRINKASYIQLWNEYAKLLKVVFNCILNQSCLNYVIFDCTNKNKAYACKLYDCICGNNSIQSIQNCLISLNDACKRTEILHQDRSAVTFITTRAFCKKEFAKEMNKDLCRYFSEFKGSKDVYQFIDHLLDTFKSYSIYDKEEKSVYLDIMSENKNGLESGCIRSFLISNAISLCEEISIESNNSEKINRLVEIVNILITIANHLVYKHRLLNEPDYIVLIIKMLQNSVNIARCKATSLVKSMLARDFKRYSHKFVEYDEKNNTNTVQLIYNMVKEYCQVFTSDARNDSENVKIYNQVEISCLKHLLRGSTKNCEKIEKSQIKELIYFASQLRKYSYFTEANEVYCTLNMILKYASADKWSDVNIANLLTEVNKCIIKSFNLKIKYANRFYIDLIEFKKKITPICVDYTLVNDEKDDDDNENENLDEYGQDEEIDNSFILNVLDSSTIEKIHDIQLKLRQAKTNKPLIFLKNMRNSVNDVIKYNELSIENQDLKKHINQQDEVIKELKQQIESLNEEINIKNDLIKFANDTKNPASTNISADNSQQTNNLKVNSETDYDLNFDKIKLKDCSPNGVRDFIQNIALTRHNLKEFRKALCGVMTHLGADLYSSPVHFLSEIIQNTEDANFRNAKENGFLKIIIDKGFICFCSNEDGFTEENVKSICSISESTKKKGQHIGNKGLGFKSVYSCTDNPIVISKPYWQFMFSKTPDNDEIAYITPIYIEGEDLPSDLNELIKTNENCNTFIYLPLKDKLKYSNSQQFYKLLIKHIDSKILIFTKKIRNLVVEDRIEGINRNISCNKNDIDYVDTSVQCLEVDIKENEDNGLPIRWRVYTKELTIDDVYVNEEKLSSHETQINLVFPIDNTEKSHFAIYCCLPIRETEFNFIINAYWCLITNRNSIKESSGYNMFLRDEIAKFYVKIIQEDVYFQKEGIFKYLPRKSDILSEWWCRFIDFIRTNLEPKVKELIGENRSFKKRLPNKLIMDIVPIEVLNSLSIEIISPEKFNLTLNDLENYGYHELMITDLLECLQNDLLPNQFKDWYQHFDSECWSKMFKLLLDSRNDISELSKSCDIFLYRQHLNNTHNESKRKKLFQNNVKYFICYKKDLYMWRDDIQILDYNSEYERKYLTEVLGIQEITIKGMIDYLIGWHSILHQDVEMKSSVWYDLDFIKRKYDDQDFVAAVDDSMLLDVICIPVNSNRSITFVSIKYSFIPSVFSINYLPIIPDDKIYPVDFDSLAIFLNEKQKNNFNEIISWERFFLKIGCFQPNVDVERVKLWKFLSSMSISSSIQLPSIKQFAEFSENDVHILESILNMLNENCFFTLQNLPIAATYLNTVKHIPVANTCLKSLFDNYLPSVEVPKYAIELAKRLGVTTELDFRCCIKVLNSCCNENIKDENVYKEWITKLQLYMNHVEPSELENIKNIKIICLNDIENNQKYFAISEIYCCDETVVVREICKQLDKTLINFDHNKTFKSIETILTKLGCMTKPNIDDLLLLIGKITFDDSIFAIKSITSMLSTDGYNLLKEIYKCFEQELKSIEEDVSKQDTLYYSDKFRKNFQLVSYDRRLYSIYNQNVIICYEQAFIDRFKGIVSSKSLFIDIDLAKQCPLLMKFLHAINFSDYTVTYLKHENNNIEYTNKSLNKLMREISKVDDFEVLRVNYLDIQLLISKEFSEKAEDLKKGELVGVTIDAPYAIFNKKRLVWCYGRLKNAEDILVNALKHFLKLIYPDKDIEQFIFDHNDKFSKIVNSISNRHLWEIYEYALSQPTPYNSNDVIFADSTVNCIEAHDFIGTKDRQKSYTRVSFENDEICFYERIKHLKSDRESFAVNSAIQKSQSYQIIKSKKPDYLELKEIGDRAEHFFCCFLKHHYSENFNEYTDWVSSARTKVYKYGNEADDSLGYDFVVIDNRGLFSSKQFKNDKNVKKCYIEVKGCKHEWDGTFNLSRNEYNKRNQISTNIEAYIIVIVEHVNSESKINISSIINWSEKVSLITLDVDTYVARYNIFRESNDKANTHSANMPKRAMYKQENRSTNFIINNTNNTQTSCPIENNQTNGQHQNSNHTKGKTSQQQTNFRRYSSKRNQNNQ